MTNDNKSIEFWKKLYSGVVEICRLGKLLKSYRRGKRVKLDFCYPPIKSKHRVTALGISFSEEMVDSGRVGTGFSEDFRPAGKR